MVPPAVMAPEDTWAPTTFTSWPPVTAFSAWPKIWTVAVLSRFARTSPRPVLESHPAVVSGSPRCCVPEARVPVTVICPEGARSTTSSPAAADDRAIVLDPDRTATSRPAVRVPADTLAEAALASRPISWLALTDWATPRSFWKSRAAPALSEPVATNTACDPAPAVVVSPLSPASVAPFTRTWAPTTLTS